MEVIAALTIGGLMIAGGLWGYSWYDDYGDAQEAGAALRIVKQAQIDYLADHPTLGVSDLTGSNYTEFLTYLPNNQLPALPDYGGGTPTIDVTVFPPVAKSGGATITFGQADDGLWDAGR